jgi:hypothetical protein
VTSQRGAWVLEGQWVEVFMAGGALAGLQKFCSRIWSVHHFGGCFWRNLHKWRIARLY